MISSSHKFVFAANTKSASTSIEHVLTPLSDQVIASSPARKHLPLAALKHEQPALFGEERDSYFMFGVMRDPIDWINSWFRYRSGNDVEAPLPSDWTFEDFWRRGDWNINHPDGSGKYLQSDIFCDKDGTVLADVILRYETLEEDFHEICEIIGIAHDLPRKNVSRKPRAADGVPEALAKEMRAFYAEDYALWNALDNLNQAGMAKLRQMWQAV